MENPDHYWTEAEKAYDARAGMLRQAFTNPGYHSRVPTGAWVHPTVPSLEYAVLLLRHAPAPGRERAETILERVIALQDADPVSPTCGIWPYVLEEPVARMAPPDGNWALFCGARVAEALAAGGESLSPALGARMETALRHSGFFAYRSNVLAAYSNIAIMGGGVAAMAGERLSLSPLLEYGRRRLESVVGSIERNGTLCEYNSIPYNLIAIHECERMLLLLRDEEARAHAETIRVAAWRMLAEIFHPGLQVFSGPQSRAYADFPDRLTVEKLSRRLGFPLGCKTDTRHTLWTGPIDLTLVPLPCPPEIAERFRELPGLPRQNRAVCHIRRSPEETTAGTTWFAPECTLGSVSRENFFYQRRPLLAYWRTPEDPAVVLKLEFLCNGRPFSSAYSLNTQERHCVLSAVALINNLGYHTPHMDCPGDGVFRVRSLRLRYVLEGRGAQALPGKDRRMILRAGGYQAVIHPVAARLGEAPGRWEIATEPGRAMVDAVIHEGEEIALDIHRVDGVEIAAGLALLPVGAEPPEAPPAILSRDAGETVLEWETGGEPLRLRVPRRPVPYLWATGRGPR